MAFCSGRSGAVSRRILRQLWSQERSASVRSMACLRWRSRPVWSGLWQMMNRTFPASSILTSLPPQVVADLLVAALPGQGLGG